MSNEMISVSCEWMLHCVSKQAFNGIAAVRDNFIKIPEENQEEDVSGKWQIR